MTRKILTANLNKEGTKGTIGMIVPDFNPSAHRSVKDFKPEVIGGRVALYKSLKKSIDEGKSVMYIDLSGGEYK